MGSIPGAGAGPGEPPGAGTGTGLPPDDCSPGGGGAAGPGSRGGALSGGAGVTVPPSSCLLLGLRVELRRVGVPCFTGRKWDWRDGGPGMPGWGIRGGTASGGASVPTPALIVGGAVTGRSAAGEPASRAIGGAVTGRPAVAGRVPASCAVGGAVTGRPAVGGRAGRLAVGGRVPASRAVGGAVGATGGAVAGIPATAAGTVMGRPAVGAPVVGAGLPSGESRSCPGQPRAYVSQQYCFLAADQRVHNPAKSWSQSNDLWETSTSAGTEVLAAWPPAPFSAVGSAPFASDGPGCKRLCTEK
mmetsp:Transcript_104608/g.322608  ORF Transcript_104608/g.322608 Transcript_104608/m.322608 type:complete len:301 (+) Transcript_104608:355-1257(+)